MIRNIVFDIGNVLAKTRFEEMLKDDFGLSEADTAKALSAMWRSGFYRRSDLGRPEKEIFQMLLRYAPELEDTFRRLVYNPTSAVTDFPDSAEWIASLRARGYRVFVLSNFGDILFQSALKSGQLGFLSGTDGYMISYRDKVAKPDREIYELMSARYSLLPDETVFLDDLRDNIAGAEAYGWHTIWVRDHETSERELAKLLRTEGMFG